jgi:hypothetical protein
LLLSTFINLPGCHWKINKNIFGNHAFHLLRNPKAKSDFDVLE